MPVFSNSTGRTTIRNAFALCSAEGMEVYLACPFYSNPELITELIRKSCSIRLIVRLGPSTDPAALREIINFRRIHVRFFTSKLFHSKLYIFGSRSALVGSANLTASGVQSNREIAVEIKSSEPEFDELLNIFQDYWEEAQVLDMERLQKYESIFSSTSSPLDSKLEKKLLEEFGDVKPSGIQVGEPQPMRERIFAETYRREYQDYLSAFSVVREEYLRANRRKLPENLVPMRIEIDSFISFLRETKIDGDEYLAQPIRGERQVRNLLEQHLQEWFNTHWQYLQDTIPTNYGLISRAFDSPFRIDAATDKQIFDALTICHAFKDRFRFYLGAMPTMEREFLRDNSPERVKGMIKHLLFGNGHYIDRMASCIFDRDRKIAHFGRACVQELYGWVNSDEVPVLNGRTTKVLRWLGFDIKVIS